MKHDWQSVPVPMGLAAKPTDARGFPITFVTLITPDGRPDFTTIDAQKIIACIELNLCGVCGGTNDEDEIAFIGGPLSIENGNFLDPPMHVDCARYAMKVCPHIAIPTARYRKQDPNDPTREVFPLTSDQRPERFGLMVTDGYRLVSLDGQPVFLAQGDVTWQEDIA